MRPHLVRVPALALALATSSLASCASGRGTSAKAATTAAEAAAPGTPAERAALALADEYVARRMDHFPEMATFAGWPKADHARLMDNSLAGVAAWQQYEDDVLARAKAQGGLRPGSPAWVAHGILVEDLETSVQARACRGELMRVGSLGGWHSFAVQMAAIQPVGTPKARTDALARFGQLPSRVDNEIANQREGLRLGLVANRPNAERMLKELDGLLALPAEQSPFLAPTERDRDPAFRAAFVKVVTDGITPAAKRYRAFLADEYLPRVRPGFGIGGLPGGEACYAAAVRAGTTLQASPKELHELGLRRLAEIHAEMAAIGARDFGVADAAKLRALLEKDPKYAYASPEESVTRARAALARAEAALPRAFSKLPRGHATVKPIPDFQAKGGAAAHYSGSLHDGAYEGIYWINTADASRKSELGDESTAFHETVPGHHLQLALAAEGGDAPLIARFAHNTAYVEGWALYAERLSDELGLFSTPFDRVGLLVNEALRAARLVADTGIHAMGWSREQALQFMLENVENDPVGLAAEVDRYSAWPGQALGYMVGAMEIHRLREAAKGALGPKFDLPAFHELVLGGGSVPMPMLRERVGQWVQARR